MTTPRLETTLLTVGELFGQGEKDATYTVPIYQRNFAWGAEQIEQLIADIQDSRSDDAAQAPEHGGRGDDRSYFLGNLVVTRRSPASGADFEVIDGQQRLTTLFLLLCVLDPFDPTHRDRLRYESRPRATETLRRLSSGVARHAARGSHVPGTEDPAILEGYNVVLQYLQQHHLDLEDPQERQAFATYLRNQVVVVRACLPEGTDLNRYFEVMNTRGQQLEQVDIVKAHLMSHLHDDGDRACFAQIWDACADMESYVQMSLTRGAVARRGRVFGESWEWLGEKDFGALRDVVCGTEPTSAERGVGGPGGSGGRPRGLNEALLAYATARVDDAPEDPDNVRFRSTIEFPAFLLHVLAVARGEASEDEGRLDDKRLITLFDTAVAPAATGDPAGWVRDFAVRLLRLRNLFDAFVLKRQYTATNGVDGDWSLRRLDKGFSNRRPTPAYRGTFTAASSPDLDEDDEGDSSRDVLLLQSMLRVTYTSPRTMHWITAVLRHLDLHGERTTATDLAELLRDVARRKVWESFFASAQPTGFAINRIVFTYLDYLLLRDHPDRTFRFMFRNSVEHFYPVSPDVEEDEVVVTEECLNLLGNLALVSVSANSKFSNMLPLAKAWNFRTTIEAQSTKLRQMAEVTRAERRWGDAQVRAHQEAMVALLRHDQGGRRD